MMPGHCASSGAARAATGATWRCSMAAMAGRARRADGARSGEGVKERGLVRLMATCANITAARLGSAASRTASCACWAIQSPHGPVIHDRPEPCLRLHRGRSLLGGVRRYHASSSASRWEALEPRHDDGIVAQETFQTSLTRAVQSDRERLRHSPAPDRANQGTLSQKTAKLMVFKLVQAAVKTWRRLKGANQLPLVIEGVTFADGVAANDTTNRAA